ncbi:MAG TPA: methyltransferase domain-containing protein [Terriglobales bacterium]|jgi:ubiquinone/menaquinone biosynthesis C-methylase UbiE|nr:methyltransferase domain-containing protein [Terriglobales bacterium]
MDKWTSGAAYDLWMGRWSRLLAHEFLNWLGPLSNLRWLDVCCGSGMLTEAIVQRFAPARVVGIDASPQQIEFACAHRSSSAASFETGDAMALPFADASFDVAVCGLGLNFIPQPEVALQEMRRVTVPNAVIAVYVWDYAEGTRFLREFWDVAAAIDPEASAYDQAHRFPMCNPESLSKMFESASLTDVTVRALDITTRFASFDDYWQPFLTAQGSAPNYLASRDEAIRSTIRERLRESIPTNSSGAIELPARAWAVRGRR